MEISEKARLATKIERIVDNHGWNGLLDGIACLCQEYYEGEEDLLRRVMAGLFVLRRALEVRCPDAPGSHKRGAEDA